MPGKVSAHVAPMDAYIVTAAVIQKCVGGNPSSGGQVRDFGEWRDFQMDVGLVAFSVPLIMTVQEATTISSSLCPSTILICGVIMCDVLEAQAGLGL